MEDSNLIFPEKTSGTSVCVFKCVWKNYLGPEKRLLEMLHCDSTWQLNNQYIGHWDSKLVFFSGLNPIHFPGVWANRCSTDCSLFLLLNTAWLHWERSSVFQGKKKFYQKSTPTKHQYFRVSFSSFLCILYSTECAIGMQLFSSLSVEDLSNLWIQNGQATSTVYFLKGKVWILICALNRNAC